MNNGLLPEDAEFLEGSGLTYELVPHGADMHLIIKGYSLSANRYKPDEVDLLVQIRPGYPSTPIDMFWIYPHVTYFDGTAPPATTPGHNFHERNWQQWSRHDAAWRPNIDNLRSFLTTIGQELKN